MVSEGRGRLKNRILGFQTTFLFGFLKDGLCDSFFVGKAHTTMGGSDVD
ncbi:hypothetical protein HMPREF1051_1886 [Neisseria sicca VK64]|uniref:Uncharacterized protein n=1 Tax=Neisseria sicca VK64 TaxID=1095748 RepID=I2NKM8_NEISI|nr:hypothetical protein HMPREF1051_1886 [Neisseria sicca VK64]